MASEPPPGSRKTMEYVIATITTRTNTTHTSRRMMYLSTFLPSDGGPGAAVPAAPRSFRNLLTLRHVLRRQAVVHRGVHVRDDPCVLIELVRDHRLQVGRRELRRPQPRCPGDRHRHEVRVQLGAAGVQLIRGLRDALFH